MERLSITITGRLGSDPRLGQTGNGIPKVTMHVAVEPRSQQDGPTRWFSVTAYRHLATQVAESLRKGDMVTVRADDIHAWTWTDDRTKETRASAGVDAYEIAASMRFDTVTTGAAGRKAAQAEAEASGAVAVNAEVSGPTPSNIPTSRSAHVRRALPRGRPGRLPFIEAAKVTMPDLCRADSPAP